MKMRLWWYRSPLSMEATRAVSHTLHHEVVTVAVSKATSTVNATGRVSQSEAERDGELFNEVAGFFYSAADLKWVTFVKFHYTL